MLEERYKVMFGVTKETFEKMLEILESANKKMHKRGGRPSRLSVLNKIGSDARILPRLQNNRKYSI